jgi:hypothetical protein
VDVSRRCARALYAPRVRRGRAAALALLAGAVVFALADRGGLSLAEQRAEAERITRAQMVDSLELEGVEYTLDGVRCVHRSDGRFDGLFECHAWASSNSADRFSGSSTAANQSDVLMSVIVCDENGCRG